MIRLSIFMILNQGFHFIHSFGCPSANFMPLTREKLLIITILMFTPIFFVQYGFLGYWELLYEVGSLSLDRCSVGFDDKFTKFKGESLNPVARSAHKIVKCTLKIFQHFFQKWRLYSVLLKVTSATKLFFALDV